MTRDLQTITFDHRRKPELAFEIVPLGSAHRRTNLDHDPTQLHRVHFYLLFLITGGTGKHTIDFNDITLQRGSILSIRKNQIHAFHNSGLEGHMMLFTEEFVVSYLDEEGARKIAELFNELLFDQHLHLNEEDFGQFLALTDEIKKEYDRPTDGHTSGIIRNLLQVLASRMHRLKSESRPDHKYTGQFLRLQQLVEQHCRENRSVQYYADQLHVTPRTLNNITHHLVKKSAKAFIDETLVLQIKRQLINSSLTIKEIAYESGFSEPTNLFKFFRRHTGLTPEAFRNTHSHPGS